jgi:Ca2+-binding RTX toxin-like protein
MKSDAEKRIYRCVFPKGAAGARVRATALQVWLGLMAGLWLGAVRAEPVYSPLVLDDPIPQPYAQFGQAVAGAGDVNGDGKPDVLIGASAQDVGDNRSQGQAFVISGADRSLLYTLDDPTPQVNAAFGGLVSGVRDVNGDGTPDLLVAAAGQTVDGNYQQGQAFVFNGANGHLLHTLDNPAPQESAFFGGAVAGTGDVNGDGTPDLLVAAPRQTVDGNVDQGQAFVFSGADGRLLHTLDDPTPQSGAEFGYAVAGVGDVNGDGLADLLVTALSQNVDANAGQGQAFVFSGADGTHLYTLDNPTPQSYSGFGRAAAEAGDVNGDGTPDLLIAAFWQTVSGYEFQGQAFVFSGKDGSLLLTLDDPTLNAGAQFGSAVAGVGDVDGDGKPDLLVGAPGQKVGKLFGLGQAFVFSGADGRLVHTLDLGDPLSQPYTGFGSAVAGAGDVNGDGAPDVLVAAPGQDVAGNENQGQAFLFVSGGTKPECFGVPATIVGTPGKDGLRGTPGDDVIAGLAGNDAIDGRGGNDVICGGSGNDVIRAGAGNDRVNGDAGQDRADGGRGRDIINGGDGDDVLSVVDHIRGNDTVNGGSHADRDVCAADQGDTVLNCNP